MSLDSSTTRRFNRVAGEGSNSDEQRDFGLCRQRAGFLVKGKRSRPQFQHVAHHEDATPCGWAFRERREHRCERLRVAVVGVVNDDDALREVRHSSSSRRGFDAGDCRQRGPKRHAARDDGRGRGECVERGVRTSDPERDRM